MGPLALPESFRGLDALGMPVVEPLSTGAEPRAHAPKPGRVAVWLLLAGFLSAPSAILLAAGSMDAPSERHGVTVAVAIAVLGLACTLCALGLGVWAFVIWLSAKQPTPVHAVGVAISYVSLFVVAAAPSFALNFVLWGRRS
jgi:hypothetical protein